MRMGAIYTHRWTSSFPTDEARAVAVAEWANALKILSDWQISYGLHKCRYSPGDWPPTLPEFIRIACNLPTLDTVTSRLLTDGDLYDPVSLRIALATPRKILTGMSLSLAKMTIRSAYDDAYTAALKEVAGLEGHWTPPERLEYRAPAKVEIADPEYISDTFEKLKQDLSGEKSAA